MALAEIGKKMWSKEREVTRHDQDRQTTSLAACLQDGMPGPESLFLEDEFDVFPLQLNFQFIIIFANDDKYL
jgi:hypothetical protein